MSTLGHGHIHILLRGKSSTTCLGGDVKFGNIYQMLKKFIYPRHLGGSVG